MASSSDSRTSSVKAPTVACSAHSPIALTAIAWSPRVDLTVADWARQGRWLGALGRGSGWWLGDWIRYGTARYGDRYRPAAQVTGYDVQSLMNMAYVAGRFQVARRRDGLSFSHHAELASLTAEEQDLWLDRAQAGALSVRSLRSELRQARQRATARGRVPASLRESDAAARVQASGGREPATTGSDPDVVCPECGHRFATAAIREVSDPHIRRQTARPPRLALAQPPEPSGALPHGGLNGAQRP
jgi:hypothetical protein